MILSLVALIAVIVLSVWVMNQGSGVLEFAGMMFVILGFCGLTGYAFAVVVYVGAGYEADIINREHGTEYTRAEVFYARSVIDTIREIDRKRMEVNGDLIAGDK